MIYLFYKVFIILEIKVFLYHMQQCARTGPKSDIVRDHLKKNK